MKNSSLHEVAKFAAGLVAADFLWLLWFSQQHLKSVSFFGMSVTSEMLLPNLIFDLALFIILVHYAWHVGKIPAMRERSYIFLVGVVFTVVAIAHIWRIFTGADLMLGDWDVPTWLSWFGVAVTTYLAYMSFHIASRMKGK
ncbi:MAG TPA: hypothetical protein VHD55_01855 [Candidatus Paceibacterota bacterium]|nr:hypothetical protein [Candidatus Paceibacterota bacterium]